MAGPPPPPPPPPPMAGLPGSGGSKKPSAPPAAGIGRDALLGDIRKGTKLKKAVTVDKSAPLIDASSSSHSGGGSSGNSTSHPPMAPPPPGVPQLGDIFAGGIPKLKKASHKDNRANIVPSSAPPLPILSATSRNTSRNEEKAPPLASAAPPIPSQAPPPPSLVPPVPPPAPPVPSVAPPLPSSAPPIPTHPIKSSSEKGKTNSSLKPPPKLPPSRPNKSSHLRSPSNGSFNENDSQGLGSTKSPIAIPSTPPPPPPPPPPVAPPAPSSLPPSAPPPPPLPSFPLPKVRNGTDSKGAKNQDVGSQKGAPNIGAGSALPFLSEINAKRDDKYVVDSVSTSSSKSPGNSAPVAAPAPLKNAKPENEASKPKSSFNPFSLKHDKRSAPPVAPPLPQAEATQKKTPKVVAPPVPSQIPLPSKVPPTPPNAPPIPTFATPAASPKPPTPSQAPPTPSQAPPTPSPKPSQAPPTPSQAPPTPSPKPSQAPPTPSQAPPTPSQAPPTPSQAPPPPSIVPSLDHESHLQSRERVTPNHKKTAPPPPPPVSLPGERTSSLYQQQNAGNNLRKISASEYTINKTTPNSNSSARIKIEDTSGRFKFVNSGSIPPPRRFGGASKEKLYPSGRGSSVPLDLSLFG